MKVERRKAGSLLKGRLPKGCRYCERGEKLVLFSTGLCGRHCFYCPISEEKKGRDVVFANERHVSGASDILREAELMEARGAGITGGDPLVASRRVLGHIKLLKRRFGDGFHIHLYAPWASPRMVDALSRAGLDEIRFHPPTALWSRMKGSKYGDSVGRAVGQMDTGIEVPLIPERLADIRALVEWADERGVGFVNLNELEFSDTNWRALRARGHRAKDGISSAALGCDDAAMTLLEEFDAGPALHYCTASFKDAVQLRNRVLRRAVNVVRPHEVLTEDGTFVKGVVECRAPSKVRELLVGTYGVPRDLVFIDREKRRLEVAPWVLEELATRLKFDCFIVEEYPTADRLEVERRELN